MPYNTEASPNQPAVVRAPSPEQGYPASVGLRGLRSSCVGQRFDSDFGLHSDEGNAAQAKIPSNMIRSYLYPKVCSLCHESQKRMCILALDRD